MSDPFHVVYLTGAPATGKSTLLSLLLQSVQPLEGLSYSTLLADHVGRQQGDQMGTTQLREHSAQIVTPEDVAAVDTQLIKYVNQRRQETSDYRFSSSHQRTVWFPHYGILD